jgi:hypothetical protein
MHIDKGFAEELLISDTAYTFDVNPNNLMDRKPGYFFTELRDSLFMAIHEKGTKPKRLPVSGILMCGLGFGVEQCMILGCRNPHALNPFDPLLLPQIVFAETVVEDNRVGMKFYNDKVCA